MQLGYFSRVKRALRTHLLDYWGDR
uniref:Uncharacterized protein n=1 Tax=Anguilla anguilla TaxID=7936 RepID=A0A0E9TN39_ANGAN